MEKISIGIIGGSGLYQMSGLSDLEEISLETPFGKPSDNLITGTLEGKRVAFLARHGRGLVTNGLGMHGTRGLTKWKSVLTRRLGILGKRDWHSN